MTKLNKNEFIEALNDAKCIPYDPEWPPMYSADDEDDVQILFNLYRNALKEHQKTKEKIIRTSKGCICSPSVYFKFTLDEQLYEIEIIDAYEDSYDIYKFKTAPIEEPKEKPATIESINNLLNKFK